MLAPGNEPNLRAYTATIHLPMEGEENHSRTDGILMNEQLLEAVKFDDKGLVGVIVQDHATKDVLMFAWMNRESLEITLRDRLACYWSRSRKKLWLKGESSGHTQKVLDIRLDCDGDAIVIAVEQKGGACHTGHRSCFYRAVEGDKWVEQGEKVFDSENVYGSKH